MADQRRWVPEAHKTSWNGSQEDHQTGGAE